MTIQEFFTKNKVLIVGLLSAVILPVYELISKGETSTKVIIMSASVALTAYLARNLRGQWATIAGIIGTVLATYIAQDQSGQPISWAQLILQGVVLFLAASSAPAKSKAYEETPIIKEAKQQAENAVPTIAPPAPQKL